MHDRITDALINIFMIIMIIITVYPFVYITMASLSDPVELTQHQGLLILPRGKVTTEAYKRAILQNPNIVSGYQNTLFYVFAGTAINLGMTVLGAYSLSGKGVKLARPVMFGIIFTMLFSGGMIPTYILIKNLGWINSRLSIVIPGAINVFNLVILRANFNAIPDSLEESARIDGANDFMILGRIVLPLSTAAIAMMIVYYGVAHWNSWFPASIYLRRRDLYPLQLILQEILIISRFVNTTEETDQVPIVITMQYATIIISTLPILAVYPFLQKYFVKGVMIGSIKG